MKILLCWLRTRMNWNMLTPISGHRYVEKYSNEYSQVLECEVCGHESVGYY